MPTASASDRLMEAMVEDYHETADYYHESNLEVANAATRKKIAEFLREHPHAVFGKANPNEKKPEECGLFEIPLAPPVYVYNFGADYLIPEYDEEFERRLYERINSPPGGYDAGHNYRSLWAIEKRLKEVGGLSLNWA